MSVRSVFPPAEVFQSATPADRTSYRSSMGVVRKQKEKNGRKTAGQSERRPCARAGYCRIALATALFRARHWLPAVLITLFALSIHAAIPFAPRPRTPTMPRTPTIHRAGRRSQPAAVARVAVTGGQSARGYLNRARAGGEARYQITSRALTAAWTSGIPDPPDLPPPTLTCSGRTIALVRSIEQ